MTLCGKSGKNEQNKINIAWTRSIYLFHFNFAEVSWLKDAINVYLTVIYYELAQPPLQAR